MLASAGVMVKTLLTLQKAEPAFETAHVLVANLPWLSDGRTPQQVAEFYQRSSAPRERVAGSGTTHQIDG